MTRNDEADTDGGTDFRGFAAINGVWCALGKECKGTVTEVKEEIKDEILFKLNDNMTFSSH